VGKKTAVDFAIRKSVVERKMSPSRAHPVIVQFMNLKTVAIPTRKEIDEA
jgi:hypothetical protein